jgi:hypothetical protein
MVGEERPTTRWCVPWTVRAGQAESCRLLAGAEQERPHVVGGPLGAAIGAGIGGLIEAIAGFFS